MEEITKLKFAVQKFAELAGVKIFFDKEHNCYVLTSESKLRPDNMICTSAGHGTGENPDVSHIYYLHAKLLSNEEEFWKLTANGDKVTLGV